MAKIENTTSLTKPEVAKDTTSLQGDDKNISLGLTGEEMDLVPLKQYFDIQATDWSEDKYLAGILNWAREKGIKDRGNLFAEISKIQHKLGSPNLGEKTARRIYRYIEIDRQISSLFKEQGAL
jgi:hypothetical protein